MQYVGTKYSQAEAEAIKAKARASVRQVKADQLQWAEDRCRRETEALRQREGARGYICKTTERARVSTPVPEQTAAEPAIDPQTQNWVEWVDARIDAKCAARLQQL
jgi:hypothetical protein